MEPEGSLPCPQETILDPILSQMNQIHTLTPYYLSYLRLSIGATVAQSI